MVPSGQAAADDVVAGTISFYGIDAYTLIDSGSTHSFVSLYFTSKFNKSPEPLGYELFVNTPSGTSMVGISVYRSCDIIISDVPLLVDLIPLSIQGFDVILGIDWLSSVHTKIDCVLKRVIF